MKMTMNKLNFRGYTSPEVKATSLECGYDLLYSSVIKITAVEGVTVAPWEPVKPKDWQLGDDDSFDVDFE